MYRMDKITTGISYGASGGSAIYWFRRLLDGYSPEQWAAIGVIGSLLFGFTKESTSRIGVANLYRLMRGYASGGLVGGGSAAASGIGGINVYAPVSVTTSQSNDTKQQQSGDGALAQAYQKVVDRSVREGIARETRPGGIIWNATKPR